MEEELRKMLTQVKTLNINSNISSHEILHLFGRTEILIHKLYTNPQQYGSFGKLMSIKDDEIRKIEEGKPDLVKNIETVKDGLIDILTSMLPMPKE